MEAWMGGRTFEEGCGEVVRWAEKEDSPRRFDFEFFA
jgi:hypothetical protein